MPTYFAKVEIIYCISAEDKETAGLKAENNFMDLGVLDEKRGIVWVDCQSSIAEIPEVEAFTPALLRTDLNWQLTSDFEEQ